MTTSLETVTLTGALAASILIAPISRGSSAEASDDKTPAAPVAPKEAGAGKPKARTDALGDPLPPQAVARLGSRRLYQGWIVRCVVLSRDGKYVVSSSWDGNRLWDAASGRELPLRQELREAAVFSTRDKLVAVAKQDLDLQLWDVVSGEKIGEILPAAKVGQLPETIHFGADPPEGRCGLALSPDGKTLVICNVGKPSVLRFCDVATGRVEKPIPLKEDDGEQTEMAFSADSKTLVLQRVRKFYAKIHVWDVDRRTERIASPSNVWDYSGPIALSPDGQILAIGSHPGKRVRLWDTHTLKELPPLLKQPDEQLAVIAFSPDGKQLAVSNVGPTVRLWDLATRKEVRQYRGRYSKIYHLVYSADGKHLAAGDEIVITFLDTATGKFRHAFWHTGPITSVAFSPDGKRLLSGAAEPDDIVYIWDPLTGKETARLNHHGVGVYLVAYSPDGKWIALCCGDNTIRLWHAAKGREVHRLQREDGFYVLSMAFAPDSKTIASGGWKKAVHFWDVATGREARSLPGDPVVQLAFSSDGKWFATRSYEERNTIQLRDITQGKQIHTLAAPLSLRTYLAFGPDGKTLAADHDDNKNVLLWDIPSGKQRRTLTAPHDPSIDRFINAIAFSPDGRCLAAAYGFAAGHEEEGCMIRLWELATGHERFHYDRQPYATHRKGVRCLAFSPDSTLLASGGDDHTILIWDVTGQRTTHLAGKDRLRPAESDALWNDLGDTDAAKAYRAMQALFAVPEPAVSLLKQRIHPAAVDPRGIERLIADLDDDRFEVRDNADRELRKVVDDAEPALQKALAGKPSLEQRRRVQLLLQVIESGPSPGRRRELRAVEVLERIGSVEAQQVLHMLAEGDPQAWLTREAKAARQRLTKRLQNP